MVLNFVNIVPILGTTCLAYFSCKLTKQREHVVVQRRVLRRCSGLIPEHHTTRALIKHAFTNRRQFSAKISVLYNESYGTALHCRSSRPHSDPPSFSTLPHTYHVRLQSPYGDRTRQPRATSNQGFPTYAGDFEYEETHAMQNGNQNRKSSPNLIEPKTIA